MRNFLSEWQSKLNHIPMMIVFVGDGSIESILQFTAFGIPVTEFSLENICSAQQMASCYVCCMRSFRGGGACSKQY